MLQRTFEYNRQDRNWLTSTHVEGRNNIRQDSQMPPDPVPSRFLDWSSLGSPCARTSPHSAPDIRVEQNENIQNQLSVPSAEVTRSERVRNSSPEEVNISPQTKRSQSVPRVGLYRSQKPNENEDNHPLKFRPNYTRKYISTRGKKPKYQCQKMIVERSISSNDR